MHGTQDTFHNSNCPHPENTINIKGLQALQGSEGNPSLKSEKITSPKNSRGAFPFHPLKKQEIFLKDPPPNRKRT